jgi:hypothetical protein
MSEARLAEGRASKELPADKGDEAAPFIQLGQLLQAHVFPFVKKHIDNAMATLRA